EVFCGYKKKLILKNVSIEIAQGEIVGIIGPNGSGKTTLLRAISGYLIPEKGQIYFKGRNLKEIPKKELARKIAVVSQNSSFDLKIKVIDFVLLGRIPYKGPFKFFEDDEDLRIALDCLSL
ncbi:ABC transporter ATP-binding protein, partial [Escherichia coli]|uniref:ATP-binding cassette domain-containing protein n=1 Tax=Escherichia coli TaxID=562 RepID=UPI00128FAA68